MNESPLRALRDALVRLTSIKPICSTAPPNRSNWSRRSLSYESLERREMLSAIPLATMSVSENTADKPQSKLWEYAGQWWSVMPKSDGTWIWRLDGTNWTPTFQISTIDTYHADVKSVGGVAHVLLFDGSDTELASVEYVGGGAGYQFWSQRPQLVGVPMGSSTETATIDIDSTGRMWTAFDSGKTVQVRYSDGDYSTWSDPITLGDLGSDDITAIIAMPNGQIGVLWSNQSDDLFGFRIHVDGTDPNSWLDDEIPASQSALDVGSGMADDHLNIKVASDGTVYAAVKTSYDKSGYTRMGLLVRRPNGVWDDLYTVDSSSSTRPIVLLNEAANRLIVAFTTSESGGNIVYRESPMDVISFSSRQTMISGTINNVTSTKQNFTDNVVLLASSGSSAKGALFSFDNIVVNQAPVVDAGPNRNIDFGGSALLDGTVTDDGEPTPTSLTTSWTMFAGPGSVSFGNALAIDTTAMFTQSGTYTLRLTANDGQRTTFDDMTVVVASQSNPLPDTNPDPPPVGSGPTEIAFQDGLFPSLSYAGTRDTYLSSKSTSSNYGSADTLLIDGSPDLATLIKWDVSAIPTGSTVTSVAIEFNVTDTSSGAYEVYALQRAWDELSATWQQYASGQNWGTAGASNNSDRSSTVLGTVEPTDTSNLRITLNASGIAAVQAWINDPAANHGLLIQDYGVSSGADFSSSESSSAALRPKLIIGYTPPASTTPPTNTAPTVDAGPNRTITLGQTAALDGTVTDDGLPTPANLSVSWTKSTGPGTVSFNNANAVDTTASFTQAGTYTLRLTVTDGEFTRFDEMTVVVENIPAPVNTAPTVDAGPNRTITLGQTAALDGTVTDDGLPTPANLSITWTKSTGPGNVSFNNVNAVDTTASFTQAGTYTLRLTVNDGEFTRFDEMTVVVQAVPMPPANVAPTVDAGPNRTITLGENAAIDGTVTDDGLPTPTNLSITWSKFSGPGNVAFNNANAIDTTASFTQAGTYTLRLTVSDGEFARSDDMIVVVEEPVDPPSEPTDIAFQDGLFPSLSYAGTRDTYLSSKSTNTNYGDSNVILIDGSPDLATLLKWDVSAIPTGSIVNSVVIELTVFDTSSGTYEIYALNRAWDELSATWNQYASGQNWGSAGANNNSDHGSTVLASVQPRNTGALRITLNAAGVAAVQAWVNDPSANLGILIQDYGISSGADFHSSEASNASQRPKLIINFQPAASQAAMASFGLENQAPIVFAGLDRSIALGNPLTLAGSASDDGVPFSPGSLTVQWLKVTGPGTVSFGSANSLETSVSFSEAGAYTLRLSAFDGELVSFDELTVNVETVVAPSTSTSTSSSSGWGSSRG